MTTPERPNAPIQPPVPRPTWRTVMLDVLRPHAGRHGLPLGTIYADVERHPEVAARSKSNQHVRSKVRQTLQRLRDEGLIRTRGPARWDIPRELGR